MPGERGGGAAVAVHGGVAPLGAGQGREVRRAESHQRDEQQQRDGQSALASQKGEAARGYQHQDRQKLKVVTRKETQTGGHAGERNHNPADPSQRNFATGQEGYASYHQRRMKPQPVERPDDSVAQGIRHEGAAGVKASPHPHLIPVGRQCAGAP